MRCDGYVSKCAGMRTDVMTYLGADNDIILRDGDLGPVELLSEVLKDSTGLIEDDAVLLVLEGGDGVVGVHGEELGSAGLTLGEVSEDELNLVGSIVGVNSPNARTCRLRATVIVQLERSH